MVAIGFRNYENNTQIYNVSDGRILRTVEHNISVIATTFNHDGTKLATASYDGTARIWDVFSGEELYRFDTRPRETMKYVAFNSDGSCIVTASQNYIMIWKGGVERIRIPYNCYKLIFSPDDSMFATASADGTARIWDLEGRELARMAHKGKVNSIQFSSDSKRLLTASDDCTICLWDISENSWFPYDTDFEGQIAFSPDSTKIEIGDSAVEVVDLATKKNLCGITST